jgi:hypothetical protein
MPGSDGTPINYECLLRTYVGLFSSFYSIFTFVFLNVDCKCDTILRYLFRLQEASKPNIS